MPHEINYYLLPLRAATMKNQQRTLLVSNIQQITNGDTVHIMLERRKLEKKRSKPTIDQQMETEAQNAKKSGGKKSVGMK